MAAAVAWLYSDATASVVAHAPAIDGGRTAKTLLHP
jgi:hypothetical protein